MLVAGLFFGEREIAEMRERVATRDWAAQGVKHIRRRLEPEREALLSCGKPEDSERPLGAMILDLALCSRLLDDWHRDAVEAVLRGLDNPAPFMFKQGFELCLALDFLPDLAAARRERLYAKILIPVGEKFIREHRGGSNIQTTSNLSLLCIGLLTGRSDFIDVVTSDSQRSYSYQLAHSVNADGFWYEQSHVSYHSGSIERMLRLRSILRRHGMDLGGDDTIQRMLETFAHMAMQGGVLPLIGEIRGDRRPTFHDASWLELAYAMYETPWIGWALGRQPRHDLWAVLVGRDIGAAEPPKARSRLLPATGLCVLKVGEDDTYWDGKGSGATITFGPHGDWHGHAGKLGIEYRRDDRYLIRDHGHAGGYGHPMHRMWYMTTLAHSTVVLDERNQRFTWCHDRPENEHRETGKCHAHLFRGDASACTVSADFAYPGCQVVRTLFLTPDYLLDITECKSLDDAEHTFDWVLHSEGIIQTDLPFVHGSLECHNKGGRVPSPEGEPYSPGSMAPASYDYIREIEKLDTGDRWYLDVMNAKWAADIWKTQDRALRVTMLGGPHTTVYKGVCPATPADVYNPVILVRRRTHRTAFIALHVPGERELDLECLRNEAGTIICQVSGNAAEPDILVKQETATRVEVNGRTYDGLLDFRKGRRTGE